MGPEQDASIRAGLDLGSNSLRLRIVKAVRAGAGGFEQIDAGRSSLRLANDAFGEGRFSERTVARLKGALAAFASAMYGQDVTCYRAVATEAFRRASNREQTVQRVREATGLRIDVIDPGEEASLVLSAVRAALGGELDPPPLVVDLGGGSLDLMRAEQGHSGSEADLESHALGLAARFQEFLEEHGQDEKARRALAEEAARIGEGLDSELLDGAPRGTPAVFVGGQAAMLDHLAEQWGMWEEAVSTRAGVPLGRFDPFFERLVSTEPMILEGLGVPADRAPMLAGAAALYLALARRVGSPKLHLPRTGLMDGLLHTLPERGHPWPPPREPTVDKAAGA